MNINRVKLQHNKNLLCLFFIWKYTFDCDWLREMQVLGNTVQKKGNLVQEKGNKRDILIG